MVEFTHRLMSGVTLILMVGLAIWAWRLYARGHIVRKSAGLALLFTVTEALVGAGLVLFELVARNESAARAVSVTIHLVNTFLLLAMTALTAWWAGSQGYPEFRITARRGGAWFALAWVGVIILGASGTVTALGDTLFPAGSLGEGLRQDLSPTAHFLIRLRVYHPVIAVLMSIFTGLLVFKIALRDQKASGRKLATLMIGLFVLQLGLGGLNVVLLAPVWMQLVHLLVADGIWITLVLWTAATFTSVLSLTAEQTQKKEEGDSGLAGQSIPTV
jgi:heme A synthase